jgi:hypothetical protein
MVHNCPHCGRQVANDEPVARVNGMWLPTACLNGDAPISFGPVVTNHINFYVGIQDPDRPSRRGFLLGPYEDYEEAERNLNRGKDLAHQADPWSAFHAFGLCSSNEVFKTVFGK